MTACDIGERCIQVLCAMQDAQAHEEASSPVARHVSQCPHAQIQTETLRIQTVPARPSDQVSHPTGSTAGSPPQVPPSIPRIDGLLA